MCFKEGRVWNFLLGHRKGTTLGALDRELQLHHGNNNDDVDQLDEGVVSDTLELDTGAQ